ncbi:MAG TPA: ABC transporter permease [Vicinamibacterales bacterium]
MKRLLAITRKEFRQLSRDHLTLRMIVMVPLMQMIIFGYAINFDVKHLPMVVFDESRSYESRELVAKMQASQYFDVVGTVDSFEEVRRMMDTATAAVALVIDRDFGKDRRQQRAAHALLIVNASDSTTSSQAMSVASGIANSLSIQSLAVQARWRGRDLPVDLRVRPWYNPDLRTANFIIPGLIAIILTFTLISFTAASIVRERELGTLEQLQVTPITRTELILGKILPFLVIGYVQLTLVVVLMQYLFGIRIAGSLAALYLLSGIFIASVLGLGIFISTLAQTQMQATQMSFFILLPFVFLSGYVFPIAGMPLVFQYLTYVIPANYFLQIVRGIVLRGASLVELWQPIAWLSFYMVIIIGLAIVRFKKTAA